MTYMTDTLVVEKIGAAMGAEVHGVDLRQPLADEVFARLEAALYECQVLFIRDQHLSADQQLALAARLGTPRVSEPLGFLGVTDPLMTMEIKPDAPPRADMWHTDTPFLANPPMVGLHCGLRIPAVGGDGVWSSLYRVFDSLSAPMKALCRSLHGVHTIDPVRSYVLSRMGEDQAMRLDGAFPPRTHALVQRHPRTGRELVFLGGNWMPRVAELSDSESDALLGLLRSKLDDLNNQIRWRWHEGDVVIWDQRSTCHRGLSDHFEIDPYRTLRTVFIEGHDAEPRPA